MKSDQAARATTEIRAFGRRDQTLNLKSMTSPSCTTYSLPSSRALPASLARLLAAEADEVVIGDGLGADEAALEIGVDDAGRLRRLGAARDGPGAHFLRAGGEIGDQAEEIVAGADQPVEARLGEAEARQELVLVRRREVTATSASIAAEMTTARAPSALGERLDALGMAVAGGGRGFVDVGDVEDRLGGQQVQPAERALLAVRDVGQTRRLAGGSSSTRARSIRATSAFASLSPAGALACGAAGRAARGWRGRRASARC